MILSIIVPIYNVEPYIAACAKSLYNHNVSKNDYEVVFVNDGTKDNSIRVLCDTIDFESVHNFRIIEKENGGLSSARNYGIRNSKGDYLWFVDSDDWVNTEKLPQIVDTLKRSNIDLLYLNHSVTVEESTGKTYIIGKEFNASTGKELACKPKLHGAPHYIIKKDILSKNNWYFKEGLLHEDSLFTPILLLFAEKVECENAPIYYYRLREGSITHGNINPKRVYDLGYIIQELIKYGKDLPAGFRFKWGGTIVELINEMLFLTMKTDDPKCREYTSRYFRKNWSAVAYLYHGGWKSRFLSLMSLMLWGNLFFAYRLLYKVRY